MTEQPDEILRAAVASRMKGAAAEHIDVITAVAGLMAAVAYSDRSISEEEARLLRSELARIDDLGPVGADIVSELLLEHALRLSTSFVPRFTRTLRDQLPYENRLEVLEALLKVASADGSITFDEISNLRNITTSLGLSQTDYNQLQETYKDLLSHRA